MCQTETTENESLGFEAQHELMVYFVIASLYRFRQSLRPILKSETAMEFADKNQEVLDKIKEIALRRFGIEISSAQVFGRAINVYIGPPDPIIN